MELGRSEGRVFNLPQFPQGFVLDTDKTLSERNILEGMKRKRTCEYAARQALNPHLSHPPPYLPRPLVEDLMYRMGMVAATDVVVSGCSAGAVQTFINTGKYLQTDIFF